MFLYKYAPKTIDEFDMPNKESLEDLTNVLLLGGERTGKTTLANLLVDKFSSGENVLYINSLKEQGIQFYRNEVKCFCQTTSLTKKMVVIDSLDEMSDQEVVDQCADLLDSTPARVLFPQTNNPESDASLNVELVASIRRQVELALAETIIEEGAVK